MRTPLVQKLEVVGVDWDDERIQRYVHTFEKRAVPPEKAAKAILTGIEKNRVPRLYVQRHPLRLLVGAQVRPPYEYVMQKANDRFSRFLPPA